MFFDVGHPDIGVTRQFAGAREPVLERGHTFLGFERVLWGNEPPNLIQMQVLQRQQADMQMAVVRRVEGAAQKPDAAPGGPYSAANKGEYAQGRTCPDPRTTYL